MKIKPGKRKLRCATSVLLCCLAVGPLSVAVPAQADDSSFHGNPRAGIVGQVLLGGYCPHLGAPGLNCAPRPLPSTVAVLSDNGKMIGEFTTDDEGRFLVNLHPGDYELFCIDPTFLFAGPVEVTVEPNEFTEVTVNFGAGIF